VRQHVVLTDVTLLSLMDVNCSWVHLVQAPRVMAQMLAKSSRIAQT
jgi:hypothetical protein